MELFKNANYDFLARKWVFIGLSLALTAVGLGSLAIKGGPAYGIDFKGGTLMYVKFAKPPSEDSIRKALAAKVPGEISVVSIVGTNEVIIGTEQKQEQELDATRKILIETIAARYGQPGGKMDINNGGQQAIVERLRDPLMTAGLGLSEQQTQDLAKAIVTFRDTPPRSGLIGSLDDLSSVPGMNPRVLTVVKEQFYPTPYAIRNVEIVGPKIGGELRRQAVYATLMALGGMLVYIAFRFEWIYGVAAVVAVFHDTILTIGLFSIVNKEISLTVVAALLTLVGYSMNDTIVVFDRIRENLKVMRRESFPSLVNSSINQTLSRTIMTSGLTLLTCLALWLFGGPVLNGFSFCLVIGIIVGTYSSVFIASPILVFWQNWVDSRKKRAAVAAVTVKSGAQATAAAGAGRAKPVK